MKFWPKGDFGEDGLTVDVSCPLVRFTVNGEQVLEATPVELPLGYQVPVPLEIQLMRMVEQRLSEAASASGSDSLEEAYDFEVDDGDDSYEMHLTRSEIHAMVHAREMTPEYPDVSRRTGGREKAADDSGKVGGKSSESAKERDGAEAGGDGKRGKGASDKSRGGSKADRGDDRRTSDGASGVASEE